MLSQSLFNKLANLPINNRNLIINSLSHNERLEIMSNWRFFARPEQIQPDGDWDNWLLLAGRGFGKTRSGAEWVREEIFIGNKKMIAVVAETYEDLRNVILNGNSGLIKTARDGDIVEIHQKPMIITYSNGAKVYGYTATTPDKLRGPEFESAWCDELAKWQYARETWDMLMFTMRQSVNPRVMITTTPRPIELIKSIIAGKEGKVHITRGKTKDNFENLSERFVEKIYERYAGTRLGRQELDGEMLGDLVGALWRSEDFDTYRLRYNDTLPEFDRVIIGVDPAITVGEEANETGIIVVGKNKKEAVVLEDASVSGTPAQWAFRVASKYREYGADCVVVEVNQGGDMVKHTLQSVAPNINISSVRASKGKHIRAEPIASIYEQGRVRHYGRFDELEEQLKLFTVQGYEGENSPDRADALVWAMTELFPDMVVSEKRFNNKDMVSGVYA